MRMQTITPTIAACVVIAASGGYVSTRTAAAAPEGNGVTTGEFVVDPPTLINLGFEWFIDGDDNRNAAVEVSYRKQGDAAVEARRCRCCGCRASASTAGRRSST